MCDWGQLQPLWSWWLFNFVQNVLDWNFGCLCYMWIGCFQGASYRHPSMTYCLCSLDGLLRHKKASCPQGGFCLIGQWTYTPKWGLLQKQPGDCIHGIYSGWEFRGFRNHFGLNITRKTFWWVDLNRRRSEGEGDHWLKAGEVFEPSASSTYYHVWELQGEIQHLFPCRGPSKKGTWYCWIFPLPLKLTWPCDLFGPMECEETCITSGHTFSEPVHGSPSSFLLVLSSWEHTRRWSLWSMPLFLENTLEANMSCPWISHLPCGLGNDVMM